APARPQEPGDDEPWYQEVDVGQPAGVDRAAEDVAEDDQEDSALTGGQADELRRADELADRPARHHEGARPEPRPRVDPAPRRAQGRTSDHGCVGHGNPFGSGGRRAARLAGGTGWLSGEGEGDLIEPGAPH